MCLANIKAGSPPDERPPDPDNTKQPSESNPTKVELNSTSSVFLNANKTLRSISFHVLQWKFGCSHLPLNRIVESRSWNTKCRDGTILSEGAVMNH